jgi:2-octaprenylphenol hydroxylase
MAEQFDILVAGAALVGAAFAARLASSEAGQGLRIAIIDKHIATEVVRAEKFDPRVVALTEASRRLLFGAGIWTEAVARQACPYAHMEVRDGEGTGFIAFDCSEVQQPNLGHIVENAVVVASAHQRLQALDNVTVIEQGIAGVQRQGEGGLLLHLDDGTTLTAPLVVAADGANSLIRERCGFALRSWDYGHSAIVATIRTAKPHGQTACQWFSPTGPLAFLPLRSEDGDSHYSSIVWSQSHEVAQQLMSLDDASFCQALTRASEERFGAVDSVSRRHSFPLRQRHSSDYVQAGVALVGDAAHTIHPLAGQGVNLGFGDVAVLAEEIERGLARGLGVGHLSTLERYQRRRKPENLAMMAAMEGFKRLFASSEPLLRVLRNSGMSGLHGLAPVKNRLVRKARGFY